MARDLVSIYLFNGQAVFSKRLFEPETKDMAGKPLDSPSYSLLIRFPKTMPNWYDEPALQGFKEACQTVMLRELPNVPFPYIEFPVKDGDRPNRNGKIPDWAKGHWFVRSSSTFIPTVEQVVGGVKTTLPALSMGGKRLWGDGDIVAAALSLGKRLNDNVGIRCYLNGALFTDHGPELQTGGANTNWDEAIAMAEAKGIKIQMGTNNGPGGSGFPPGGAPGGFGGFPPGGGQQGGFGGGFNPGAQQQQPGGFQQGAQPGGFGGFQQGAQQQPGGFPSGGQQGAQQPGGFPSGGQQQQPGGFNPGGGQQGGFNPGYDPNKPPF